MNRYTVGQAVTTQGAYTNHDTGAPTDPSDAKVDVVDPTGKSTTYTYLATEVTKVSVGLYTFDVDTTGRVGRWQYRWWSPPGGGPQTASRGTFFVDPFPSTTP